MQSQFRKDSDEMSKDPEFEQFAQQYYNEQMKQEEDPFANHYEKLQTEYKEAQENFDLGFYIIAFLLFVVMVKVANYFGLQINFEEDQKENTRKQ